MKKLYTTLFLLLLIFRSTPAQTPLTIAPNFSVKTTSGPIIELYPLLDQGKVVVLNFYTVSCGPCQLYAPHFQAAFEAFGRNLGNVFFLGINFNGNNSDVIFFESVYGLDFPSASGLDGGGNAIFNLFQLSAYPTVLVIRPDKSIANPYVWPPTTTNITDAVVLAGGTLVGISDRTQPENLIISPSPVRGNATIQISINYETRLSMQLLDAHGRLVVPLLSTAKLEAGSHKFNFSSEGLTNGIFFVDIVTDKSRFLKKIIVINR